MVPHDPQLQLLNLIQSVSTETCWAYLDVQHLTRRPDTDPLQTLSTPASAWTSLLLPVPPVDLNMIVLTYEETRLSAFVEAAEAAACPH